MKDGATRPVKNLAKATRPESNGDYLRRPNKLQPTGKDKYRLGKSSQWVDEDDELDDNFDPFKFDDDEDEDELDD